MFHNSHHTMQALQRKPRVFLSHSKKDVAFIRRLESDLRKSQCEIWIDEIEIRHGRPWLDEIFSNGIPSCEVVLCYITSNSATSQMVQREIDARVVERLANDRVTLLLYVESDEVRSRLRSDLQTLQVPILNDTNYSDILPRIVAEVWRSYIDAAIAQAVQWEKVKRLELEIELRNTKESLRADIFSPQEQAEFSNAWSRINRDFDANVKVVGRVPLTNPRETRILAENSCTVSFGQLFRKTVVGQTIKPSNNSMLRQIGMDLLESNHVKDDLSQTYVDFPFDYESEFLRYGLLHRAPLPQSQSTDRIFQVMGDRYELIFTERFDRFCLWLETSTEAFDPERSVIVGVR